MKFLTILPAAIVALATPVLAESHMGAGDPAAGEDVYKKCRSCHAVVSPDGETIQKGGKTGPNLYGIIGKPMGADPDFRYSDLLEAANEQGLVWDAASLAAYVVDPTAYLQEVTGESGRSKMTLKLNKGGEDVAAYLASVAE
ncbi:c-type cytochrome [Mesobacterium pallidum]|uniref:c-type cytochrome n=1 Tax=Mesobacterium pallidum TaxID=2872037 RepID=UPI001EE353C6|nr:cytochrome C [Mesobacterium pallidum]